LRKKLLIISKSQHELFQGFNHELTEMSQIYNSPLFSALNQASNKDQMFQIDLFAQKNIEQSDQIQSASSILLTPLYQFQQTTIELQQTELDQLKQSYKSLLEKFDSHKLELETCKKNSILKVLYCDYFIILNFVMKSNIYFLINLFFYYLK
jgi:hypothetical protein